MKFGMVEAASKLHSLLPHDGMTFCNEFVQISSFIFGIEELKGKMISEMHFHVKSNPKSWNKIGSSDAQKAANSGYFVVALYSNPGPAGDHGCIIVPGKITVSGSWGCEVPNCANVGKTNFYGKPLSYAFKKEEAPELFVYHGDQNASS